MSNITTGGYETIMSKTTQKYLTRSPLFRKLASFQENNTLSHGVSVNRPYRGDFNISTYTPNTDVVHTDWSLTEQLLTVNQSYAASIVIDPVEQKQAFTNLNSEFAPRLAYQLGNKMDRSFFDETANAGITVDAAYYGAGASGAPIDLGSVNAERVWSDAFAELIGNSDEYGQGMYAVIDAKMLSQIQQRGIATTFSLSDMVFRNGMANGPFVGFDVYVSKNLPATAAFTLANAIPAASDTVSIAGVTFTFQTTLGASAGSVLSEVSVTQTGANLAAAINAGAGAGTKYVAICQTDRDKLNNAGIVATNNAGVVTLTSYGRMLLAKNFATSANGVWGTQTVYASCGQYGAVDMVAQMEPTIQINKAVNNLGSTIIGHSLWGTRTFNDGAQRLLKLLIKG